jgi:hypothetical protein
MIAVGLPTKNRVDNVKLGAYITRIHKAPGSGREKKIIFPRLPFRI